ncbi:MAG: septum formation initiator family protein [Desulfobacteraceae bacterium]|nr:MAG: septum formation initiator family protein [Desulfobacteraceae bacterium]
MKKIFIKISPSILIMILIVFLTVIWFGFNENGFVSLYKERNEREVYIERIKVLNKENDDLFSEIERLRNDMSYVESVARRELNMLRDNEVLFKSEKKDSHRSTGEATKEKNLSYQSGEGADP